MLPFLYRTPLGRALLKSLTCRFVSKLVGAFMESRASTRLISSFVKKNGIDLEDYVVEDWQSFNEFFCRRINPEARPVERDPKKFVAPCDGLLTVYPIQDGLVVPVKQSEYSIARLLDDPSLAANYDGGLCLVFRLCVTHYHRYGYAESGRKSANRFISGKLHTVQPIALESRPVFIENCREYATIETENWGRLVQMEVGALMVGKIANAELGEASVSRCAEKGMFKFGGSTIILLIEKARLALQPRLLTASAQGIETPVKFGEPIGEVQA